MTAARAVPEGIGAGRAREVQGANLVMLDGLGHMPMEEDPSRCVAPVVAFPRGGVSRRTQSATLAAIAYGLKLIV